MPPTLAYSASQVRAAEAPLLAAGVPLMQRAADGLAEHLRALAPEHVLLLVGTGDNGGDALYAGAQLASEGIDVAIIAAGERMHEEGLAAALAAGAHVESRSSLADAIEAAEVIVDGLVGTGSTGPLRGGALEIVEGIPAKHGTVVAVDIPSGVNPDDGSIDSAAIQADVTVTFGALKAGLLLDPGKTAAGRVELVDIGLDLAEFAPTLTVA